MRMPPSGFKNVQEMIGVKVLYRSPYEDEPLLLGVLDRFDEGYDNCPVIIAETNTTHHNAGSEYLCAGFVVPDGTIISDLLFNLSNQQQWNFLSNIFSMNRLIYAHKNHLY